jgi:maltose O-acetyltransferase
MTRSDAPIQTRPEVGGEIGLAQTGPIHDRALNAEERSPPEGLTARILRAGLHRMVQPTRILKYRVLSNCRWAGGPPRILQPVLFIGPGTVLLGEDVQFGWRASPHFYSGYSHVEVSEQRSLIDIGPRTEFNNNLTIKSQGAGIQIGRDGLFGASVEIFDSDFHDLDPGRRREPTQRTAPVVIGDNVFVGMGVRILKGVTIGSDSVIGAGSVVSRSIPAGVVAAGNPARVVRTL